MRVNLRERVLASDPSVVREIVRSTGFFSEQEVELAIELVLERLARGTASGYFFLFAECEARIAGYACYGPIPCTRHSYDVYWIAVHPDWQGRGVGRTLLCALEQRVAAAGGCRIYVETSGRQQYGPTRSFYEHNGYRCEAVLTDFYAPGDDKMIYVKELRRG